MTFSFNLLPKRFKALALHRLLFCIASVGSAPKLLAQTSGAMGNGLSAAAIARGGSTVTETGSPLDSVEGNPAGLAGASSRLLDIGVMGVIAGGSFHNISNADASLRGVAAALPYGAFATPLGKSSWRASAAFTPEILMRANWHYMDAPGTEGVTYGYQRQETQIIAVRSSLAVARALGRKWSAGVTVGIVYNENTLNAPYIFQQQPQVEGLKVLLALKTHGSGWNGTAGVQWQPMRRLRAGLAWKSGTSIHTQGSATGSASALFTALGIKADPEFGYHVQVQNNLPEAAASGMTWQMNSHVLWAFEGDFTRWHTAFRELPISLTQGTNEVINSVVGSNAFHDAVPLQWRNQGTYHGGAEIPLSESWTLRGGYSYASNPVPERTLLPLTAAIMQHTLATGAGWTHDHWRYDAAYQVQLPSTSSVRQSSIVGGEYNDSTVRIWTQSVTLSARVHF